MKTILILLINIIVIQHGVYSQTTPQGTCEIDLEHFDYLTKNRSVPDKLKSAVAAYLPNKKVVWLKKITTPKQNDSKVNIGFAYMSDSTFSETQYLISYEAFEDGDLMTFLVLFNSEFVPIRKMTTRRIGSGYIENADPYPYIWFILSTRFQCIDLI